MKFTFSIAALMFSQILFAQKASISGKISGEGSPLAYATITLVENQQTVLSDIKGKFVLSGLSSDEYQLVIGYLGYESQYVQATAKEGEPALLNIELKRLDASINPIVVTGTKTFKHLNESAVMVHVVDARSLENLQVGNLSEGLKFQPGLRVETDCQTCNYTQLRMNGLGGAYSQILINGRPIFSPLTALYGMDQIPTNMIDRIETVRGGASSLYGSSAIGGTVNIITRIPRANNYRLQTTYSNIGGSSELNSSANLSKVSKSDKAGISVFANHRKREIYDHNQDGFSELPRIENKSIGAKVFLIPKPSQKLEFSLNLLNEIRYGGELNIDLPHQAQQAEDREHNVGLYSLDYQSTFSNGNSIQLYAGGQHTSREHYTGILPDDSNELAVHRLNPPYGTSFNYSLQGGVQFNFSPLKWFKGKNRFSFGSEFLLDDVIDEIPAYEFKVDQQSRNAGLFLQSDWDILPQFNALTGVRIDKHNFVDAPLLSPRLSLLYKPSTKWQLRGGYSSGFRAPQAFDTDLHIAFAGGGVSRISLSEDLIHERSHSGTFSINYDAAYDSYIYGFTVEAFYTSLENVFVLEALGEDAFGERFEKRNGEQATVQGVTVEGRFNFNQVLQFETGITLQSSQHRSAILYSDALAASKRFLRTPDHYGYLSFNWDINSHWSTNINAVYTGNMLLLHMGGSELQTNDEYVTSPDFTELNLRLEYHKKMFNNRAELEIFGGIKNVRNAYQRDFDIGKNRDSNYIYGPALPRSIFIGIAWLKA